MSEKVTGKVAEVFAVVVADVHLRSSVALFKWCFCLHLCRGKLLNKRVIVQLHNKTTIYIVFCSTLYFYNFGQTLT